MIAEGANSDHFDPGYFSEVVNSSLPNLFRAKSIMAVQKDIRSA